MAQQFYQGALGKGINLQGVKWNKLGKPAGPPERGTKDWYVQQIRKHLANNNPKQAKWWMEHGRRHRGYDFSGIAMGHQEWREGMGQGSPTGNIATTQHWTTPLTQPPPPTSPMRPPPDVGRSMSEEFFSPTGFTPDPRAGFAVPPGFDPVTGLRYQRGGAVKGTQRQQPTGGHYGERLDPKQFIEAHKGKAMHSVALDFAWRGGSFNKETYERIIARLKKTPVNFLSRAQASIFDQRVGTRFTQGLQGAAFGLDRKPQIHIYTPALANSTPAWLMGIMANEYYHAASIGGGGQSYPEQQQFATPTHAKAYAAMFTNAGFNSRIKHIQHMLKKLKPDYLRKAKTAWARNKYDTKIINDARKLLPWVQQNVNPNITEQQVIQMFKAEEWASQLAHSLAQQRAEIGFERPDPWGADKGKPRPRWDFSKTGTLHTRARGGMIPNFGVFQVPGTGNGDTVNANVPAGSFVVNKKASAALMGARRGGETPNVPVRLEPGELVVTDPTPAARRGLAKVNADIPRFQKGGEVLQKRLSATLSGDQAPAGSGEANQLNELIVAKIDELVRAYVDGTLQVTTAISDNAGSVSEAVYSAGHDQQNATLKAARESIANQIAPVNNVTVNNNNPAGNDSYKQLAIPAADHRQNKYGMRIARELKA